VTAIIRVSAPEENCTPLGACVRKRVGVLESHRVTGTDRLMLKVVVRSIADRLDPWPASPLWHSDDLDRPHVKIARGEGRREELVSIRLREHTKLHWFALPCF
jgi:hypothetical protein